jgi:CrcB protein
MTGARREAEPTGTMAPTPARTTADHRSVSAAAMVFLGGAVGTVAREALDLATPEAQLVLTTLVINVVGSFALAVVYAVLLGGRTTAASQRRVRLLVGTGFMGGFTTYGSFAVGVAAAAAHGSVTDAGVYAVASIVLGVLAALLGRAIVENLVRRSGRQATTTPEEPS